MGGVWLRSLPDVLRDAGLVVDTYPNWENRARSTGGYDGVFAVQVHHTASSSSPGGDMSYMWEGSPDRPVGAIYLARDGRVTVGAAGATNTSGKGGPRQTVHGTIPLDSANKFVISIEAANNGVGEPWPAAQQDAYIKMCAALNAAYDLSVGDTHAHFEWTDRKIDPAGNSRYASGGNKWNMDAFRGDVFLHGQSPVIPPSPIPGGSDVIHPIHPFRSSDTRIFGGKGLAPNKPGTFSISSTEFPENTIAVAMNVTVVEPQADGFLTVWPNGNQVPNASCVNFPRGGIHNSAIVCGIEDRKFWLNITAQAHVIFDITAYWTP
jgi:hypothetical protein